MVSVVPNLGVDLGFGVEKKKKLEGGDSIFDLDETLTLTLTLKGKGWRRGGTYLGFLASVDTTVCTGRRPRRRFVEARGGSHRRARPRRRVYPTGTGLRAPQQDRSTAARSPLGERMSRRGGLWQRRPSLLRQPWVVAAAAPRAGH